MNEFEDIGGYFELELPSGNEYHNNALRFNTGRNALSYFLVKKKITDLYIPFYISDKVINSVKQGKTNIHFYHLDEALPTAPETGPLFHHPLSYHKHSKAYQEF